MMAPMAYVRKKPKGFGRNAQIEGDVPEGKKTLLVEDLTTDGASKIRFAQALRDAGAICDHTFVVFYYGVFPGSFNKMKAMGLDRKSTRLNSSHANISYAVFCLKKKKTTNLTHRFKQ